MREGHKFEKSPICFDAKTRDIKSVSACGNLYKVYPFLWNRFLEISNVLKLPCFASYLNWMQRKKNSTYTNFRQIDVSINKFGKQEWACILLNCQFWVFPDTINLFMSFGTIFWDVILGWYYDIFWWKLFKQTSYWSKTEFFFLS